MDYVRLGSTGLLVSKVCLGTMTYGSKQWRDWILEEEAAKPFFEKALDLGINFFDTADIYSVGVSEEVTGKWLRSMVPNRSDYVLATKVYFPMGDGPNMNGLSRKHIMDAIDASLQRLGLDYVDLYQIHRFDPNTPIEETMEALNDVVKAGKARYIGASSMYAWQFAMMQHTAERHGWVKFVSMQNHYNLIYREEEREMNPFCEATGVGLLPWSPLARGFLAGARSHDEEPETLRGKTDDFARELYEADAAKWAIIDRVKELADRHQVTAAQISLAWLMHRSGVSSPIVGASKLHHLEEAAAAADVSLTEADIAYLAEPYLPREIVGHD